MTAHKAFRTGVEVLERQIGWPPVSEDVPVRMTETMLEEVTA